MSFASKMKISLSIVVRRQVRRVNANPSYTMSSTDNYFINNRATRRAIIARAWAARVSLYAKSISAFDLGEVRLNRRGSPNKRQEEGGLSA